VEASSVKRPGRQLVTFLLVGNFALWLLNRVKNARAEFHPLQVSYDRNKLPSTQVLLLRYIKVISTHQ
jgi:hypothetical protein